jgi:hypothetical protein
MSTKTRGTQSLHLVVSHEPDRLMAQPRPRPARARRPPLWADLPPDLRRAFTILLRAVVRKP